MKIQRLEREAALLRAPAIKDILPCLVLFVVSRGSLLGFFPFGIAYFAAVCDKSVAYLAITVMYISLLSAGAMEAGTKYILAALLFWIYCKAIPKKLKRTEGGGAALCIVLGGIIYMLQTHFSLYGFAALGIEAVVVFFMYEVFYNSKHFIKNPTSSPSHAEIISCAVFLGVVVISTSDITLPYSVHPSIIFAIYVLLLSALLLSSPLSASVGIVTGFIAGLNTEAITLSGIMGIGVLTASMLKNFKRFGVVCGFLGGICITLLYVPQSAQIPVSILDALIGCVAFCVTPKKALRKIPEFFSCFEYSSGDLDRRALDHVKNRIKRCSDSFYALQKTFLDATKKREEIKKVHPETLFDNVCQSVCTSCPSFTRCYECSFDLTHEMFRNLFERASQKGTLKADGLPLSFREQCPNIEKLISEFMCQYTLSSQSLIHLGQMRTGADLCALQYGEIASILSLINEDVTNGFVCCPELEKLCANELSLHNIPITSLCISENRFGSYEILLGTQKTTDLNLCERLISDILMTNIGVDKALSNGLYHLVSKPQFSVDIGALQKGREEICGDCINVFATNEQKLYAIISDGMGCGESARAESDICVTLTKEFILAGFSPQTAIALTNSALCLKNEDETFATIDLCEIDLITGIANFYKIGSAVSLLYDNGQVDSVYSASLPAGMLPHLGIKAQRRVLSDANMVLMVSDGITEAGEIKTDWLRSILKTPHTTMQEKAEAIMEEATKKSGGEIKDDMSVVCIMLKTTI